MACLVPFLGGDTLESLPYMIATAFQVLPSTVHHDLINTLCYFVIPFTIRKFIHIYHYVFFISIIKSNDNKNCNNFFFGFLARNKCMNNAALSVAGILLLVFQNTFDTGNIKYKLNINILYY